MYMIRLELLILTLALLIGSTAPEEASFLTAQRITATQTVDPQSQTGPIARFAFDGTVESVTDLPLTGMIHGNFSFVEGLDGQALSLDSEGPPGSLTFDSSGLPFASSRDFSIRFWMRTEVEAGKQFVVLSQKDFIDNSLASQKGSGWVFYVSGGTWAWSMGSGSRRITYERDNGQRMPLNDGVWHQLAMTYSSAQSEIRLFYDGVNWVSYHVSDSDGFDFTNSSPMVVGLDGRNAAPQPETLPLIEAGAEQLQRLVDAFNGLGLTGLESDEFIHLIVDSRRLFEEKVNQMAAQKGADSIPFRQAMEEVDWEPITEAESGLMSNPYTVHQNLNFTGIAPVMKVYALVDREVVIREDAARGFAEKESFSAADFQMDDLAVWDRVLSPEEVLSSYSGFMEPAFPDFKEKLTSLTAGSWNIWHGGKHFTVSEDGWDSRVAIANMLEDENTDVIMMQETYSSGDFIAAELGFFFATTVDWDYLNQGANISVLSRFPIKELHVQEDSPFQNVGVKVAISRTQDMYVMSNWYGMDQFPAVFEFHQARFQESDIIPTLFAGDFNAVPHTDGGDSPASPALLDAGFTDAYRSLSPDVELHPGASHRNGRRIDQLYYKGAGLTNTSTRVISIRPGGFPSDHFLILSTFDLDYSTFREPDLNRPDH